MVQPYGQHVDHGSFHSDAHELAKRCQCRPHVKRCRWRGLLGGQHVLSDIVVHKPFVSSDRSSVGLHGWYADLTVDRFTSKNISTGMFLEDSNAVVDSLEANIGSEAGVRILDSTYTGHDLTTIAQDLGVSMEGDASLHLSSWAAQLHDTPLMMSSENTAIIRFSPLNTALHRPTLSAMAHYYGSIQPDHQHLHLVSVHRNRCDVYRPRGSTRGGQRCRSWL